MAKAPKKNKRRHRGGGGARRIQSKSEGGHQSRKGSGADVDNQGGDAEGKTLEVAKLEEVEVVEVEIDDEDTGKDLSPKQYNARIRDATEADKVRWRRQLAFERKQELANTARELAHLGELDLNDAEYGFVVHMVAEDFNVFKVSEIMGVSVRRLKRWCDIPDIKKALAWHRRKLMMRLNASIGESVMGKRDVLELLSQVVRQQLPAGDDPGLGMMALARLIHIQQMHKTGDEENAADTLPPVEDLRTMSEDDLIRLVNKNGANGYQEGK